MAHDVFISYASEDFQVADRVRQALEEQGIKCWIAPRDVPYGSKYEEAILDGIATSPLLILVLSTHSNASPHVEREIQNACSEGSPTRIIPVRIDNIQYSKSLRYYLSSTQWLDASTPPLENHLQRLVEYVRSALPRGDGPEATADQPTIVPTEVRAGGAREMLPERGGGGETHKGTRDERESVPPPGDGARSRTLMLAVGGALVAIGLIAVAAFVLTRGRRDDPPRVGNANEIVSVSPTPASTTPTPRTTPANTNQTTPTTPTPTPANPTPQPTPSPASPTPQPTPATTTTPAVQPSPGGLRLPGLGSLLSQRLIEQAFSKDEELKSVKVSVKDGVVTLTGTVSSVRARDAAELIASTVKGVRKVDNQIEVK